MLNTPLEGGLTINNLLRLMANCRLYFRYCLKIKDEHRRIIPFIPNPEQERLIEIVERWKLDYPEVTKRPTLYIIILKAWQMGFSTCTEAIFFHGLNFSANTVAMVVSYDEDSAASINDMAGRFYQHLPDFLRPLTRPSRGKGLLFENPRYDPGQRVGPGNEPGRQNKFLIETAGNTRAGSGYTINYLHLSELAKWPGDAAATLTSLLQAVPDQGGLVVIESTARGFGNLFRRLWQAAKNGENGYLPLFVPWHAHTGYIREFGSAAERERFTSDEEESNLIRTYGLTPEQLNWRRSTIRDKCGGDPAIFRQEYPADDSEAFLMTGRPRFDRQTLGRMLAAVQPGMRGNIREKDGRLEFVREEAGYLTRWEEPVEGEEYLIAADVAEGLARGDYSSADVLRRKANAQVAHWHGHIDPDLLGGELARMARYYNRAIVVPEVNNHGLTTVTALRKVYGRVYRRKTVDAKLQNRTREEYGWRTDARTKPLMIDRLAECIREGLVTVPGRETLTECLSYCIDDKGGTGAPAGGFDDRVISLAIGVFVNLSLPYGEEGGEEPEYPVAFGRTNY